MEGCPRSKRRRRSSWLTTSERGTLIVLGLTSILRNGFRMAGKNFIKLQAVTMQASL